MNRLLISIAAISVAGCGERASTTDVGAGSQQSGTSVSEMASVGDANTAETPMAGAQPAGADGADTNSPQGYIAAAASSDQFEIQSSQLAMEQSKNAKVKSFAQQMISDHRASTEKLANASQQAAVASPPTVMMAKHQNQLTALQQAGANIDQVYMSQQRAAHMEAIALHQGFAQNAAAPQPLVAFATEVLPRVQSHAKMLDGIKI